MDKRKKGRLEEKKLRKKKGKQGVGGWVKEKGREKKKKGGKRLVDG